MASAGQAQAHSSQPMHFSRPSGHRLSWWRPWNLGAVGRLSSGYSTVSTFLNIWWKVTPKPLIGSRKSSIRDLLAHAGGADPVVVGKIQRGNGEARLGLVGGFRLGQALQPGPPAFRARLPHPDDHQEEDEHEAADDVDAGAAALTAPDPDGGDHHDPDERAGDENLPAQRHPLGVAEPGQRAAQPDEAEQQDERLGQEPQQRPPAAV